MKNSIVIFALLLLGSCKTLEQKCIERFPVEQKEIVRETLRTDTLILPDSWVEIEFIDTTECLPSVDTIYKIKTIRKEKQLPPDTIYHDVMCIDSVIVYEDKELVEYLTGQLEITEALLKSKKKDYRKLLIGGGIALGVLSMVFLGILLLRKRKTR